MDGVARVARRAQVYNRSGAEMYITTVIQNRRTLGPRSGTKNVGVVRQRSVEKMRNENTSKRAMCS